MAGGTGGCPVGIGEAAPEPLEASGKAGIASTTAAPLRTGVSPVAVEGGVPPSGGDPIATTSAGPVLVKPGVGDTTAEAALALACGPSPTVILEIRGVRLGMD